MNNPGLESVNLSKLVKLTIRDFQLFKFGSKFPGRDITQGVVRSFAQNEIRKNASF